MKEGEVDERLTGSIFLYNAVDELGFHGVHDKVRDPRDRMSISVDSDPGDV